MKTANLIMMFFLLGCSASFAQIQKGTIYLAPTRMNQEAFGAFGIADDKLSANLQKEGESEIFTFALLPTFGYAVTNNLVFWGSAGLYNQSVSSTSYTNMSAQLNGRFYLNPNAKNNHFFVEAGGKAYFPLEKEEETLFGYQAMLGLTSFIAPSVAWEIGAGHTQLDEEGSFLVSSGFAVFLNEDNRGGEKIVENPIQKGRLMIGNDLLTVNILKDENRAFAISPHLSYFLSNKFSAGISLKYTNVNIGIFEQEMTLSNLFLEPQLRYYAVTKPKTSLFASVGGGLNLLSTTFMSESETETDHFYGFGLGVNAFINRNVAFELGPNLRHFPELKSTRVGLDLGLRMFL